MYQPCFSDMLSSEIVSSVSIAPMRLKKETTKNRMAASEQEAELSGKTFAVADGRVRCCSANSRYFL